MGSKPTTGSHSHPSYQPGLKAYAKDHHGEVTGCYSGTREALIDYSYHCNYTLERQDSVVKLVAESTESVDCPWLIFSCGAMGAGKGYAMRYLSRMGVFPLEKIAHVDPDHFKQVMPEWDGYKAKDSAVAGTMCHQESGFL